jgi:flagellar biosynthesis regulator FlaF
MMMYQFPYTTIIDEPPARLPPPSQLISNAIELFEASSRSGVQPFEQLQLLSDSRRLWLLIADVLPRAPQEPKTQRARFLADVQRVLQEVERRRFEPSARFAAGLETRPGPLS